MLSLSPVGLPAGSSDDALLDMDQLLTKLRRGMVELILQGDDVSRQMWQMYSVFEEIFGLQKISSKTYPVVVVGEKLKHKLLDKDQQRDNENNMSSASPTATVAPATATVTTVIADSSPAAAPQSRSPAPALPAIDKDPSKTDSSTPEVANQRYVEAEESCSLSPRPPASDSSSAISRTSNPLLDTIGVLAGSNPDSDDSDLDMVYQQLRYRGRHRRPEQGRIRTTRHHHHQQFASSDPESTSYAGSNSIDSGYKSQCATPEVSDNLSAPEVRRSASDVSASDSSTTSGRPRSSEESKNAKIKMGTRSMAQSTRPSRYQQSPLLESSMTDVTLDHLMYLRQSRRKDRQDYHLPSSSHSSLPSSSASSTVRDEISPTALSDEEDSSLHKSRIPKQNVLPQQSIPQQNFPQQTIPQQQRQSPLMQPHPQQSFIHPVQFTSMESPSYVSPSASAIVGQGARSGRRLSAGNELDSCQAVSGECSDFLLSGVEFYDLDSVRDFPQRRGYVAMVEEKTRHSRIHIMAAPKREMPIPEHRGDPSFRKRKDPTRTPPSDHANYGYQRRSSMDSPMPSSRGSDSKLTEAAIRVLEMIEDFRMEEALENASSFSKMERVRSNVTTTVGPHAFVPRFRQHSGSRAGMRPVSTGSLSNVPLDTRSVVSAASSYATSAEHHVYEEIVYDLVGERPDHGAKPRNRLLPMRPGTVRGYQQGHEHARVQPPRSQKHRSNIYSIVAEHDSRNAERMLEMEWNLSRGRRDLSSDFPS